VNLIQILLLILVGKVRMRLSKRNGLILKKRTKLLDMLISHFGVKRIRANNCKRHYLFRLFLFLFDVVWIQYIDVNFNETAEKKETNINVSRGY
jgi:hypothetical protein